MPHDNKHRDATQNKIERIAFAAFIPVEFVGRRHSHTGTLRCANSSPVVHGEHCSDTLWYE